MGNQGVTVLAISELRDILSTVRLYECPKVIYLLSPFAVAYWFLH